MQFYKDTIELAKALKAKEKVRVTELLLAALLKSKKRNKTAAIATVAVAVTVTISIPFTGRASGLAIAGAFATMSELTFTDRAGHETAIHGYSPTYLN